MGSSILQAILGGVAGGAQGIAEVREQRRLEEERRAEAERRARMERLQYIGAGFVPESSAGAMDMPGATPRKPFMSEVLSSGERMVMERSPDQASHLKTMQTYGLQRDQKRAEESRAATASETAAQRIDAALEAAGVSAEQRGLVRSGAVRASDVMPKDTSMSDYQREQIRLREAELGLRRQQAGREKEGGGRLPPMGLGETEQAAIGGAWLRSLPADQQAAAMERVNQVFTDIPQLRGKGMIAAYYAMTPQERAAAEAASKPQASGSGLAGSLPSFSADSTRTAAVGSAAAQFRPTARRTYDMPGGSSAPAAAPSQPPIAPPARPPVVPATPPVAPPTTPPAAPPARVDTAAALPSAGANPFADLSAMGVDMEQYNNNPEYRAWVQRQMAGR